MHFEPGQGRAEVWRILLLCFFSLAQKCFPSICNGHTKCNLQCITLHTNPRSAPFPSVELFLPLVPAGSIPAWPDPVPGGG